MKPIEATMSSQQVRVIRSYEVMSFEDDRGQGVPEVTPDPGSPLTSQTFADEKGVIARMIGEGGDLTCDRPCADLYRAAMCALDGIRA